MESGPLVTGNEAAGTGRRMRQRAPRRRRVEITFTEEEFKLVLAAAGRHRLSNGAYAAAVVLDAAEHRSTELSMAFREALTELIRSAGLVRRAGANLNQAAARFSATGQPGPDLEPAIRYCMRVIRRLDETAEKLRRGLP